MDNLEYLKEHKIDKNQVSQELARIFSQMVYLNGFFRAPFCIRSALICDSRWYFCTDADPHAGNLLVRLSLESPAKQSTVLNIRLVQSDSAEGKGIKISSQF